MFLLGLWVDPLYLILFIVTLVTSGAAQTYVKSTFGKWSGVRNGSGLSGLQHPHAAGGEGGRSPYPAP